MSKFINEVGLCKTFLKRGNLSERAVAEIYILDIMIKLE
jgi:hypothetical protein